MARVEDEMEDAVESSSGDAGSSSHPTVRHDDDVPPHQLDTMQRINEMVRRRLSAAERRKERIGRYLVLEEVGRGGMGMVYAAYDEQLDRKVAVKVLLDDALGTEQERLRSLREAQALARLSHPNVVTIHEVGEDDGQFFLAMEFVRGQNLSTWLGTAPPWREVLEVFVHAGRGLAAAHDAGLIHRDLKPANIVRSDDGTVKVLDFGLVRVEAEAESESEDPLTSSSALSMHMTRTGALMGTPAYMAPEQLTGDEVSPRSDQYSFCLALWEGLAGARPFVGSTLGELRDARLASSPQWPSSAPPVPRAIVAALVRGLSVQPEDRWPSMQALLTVLAWDPERRRTRRWLAAATVGVLGLGGVLVHDRTVVRQQPCSGSMQVLAGIWDEARRADVRSVIEDDERPYTREVWSSTDETLSAYADAWVATRTEACEATTVRGEQSPRLLDLRMRCLDRAATELTAVVDTLSDTDADDEVARRAHRVIAGLPPLSRCSDAEALEAEVEPPLPSEAPTVEEARRLLARAKSLRSATRHDETRVALVSATEQLEGIEYGPVKTELVYERGKWLEAVGEHEDASRALSEAAELALKWQQRPLLVSALRASIRVVGWNLNQTERALMLWPLLRGASGDDPVERARDRVPVGDVLREHGKYDEAIAMHREALSLLETVPEAPLAIVASARTSLANDLYAIGRVGEAEAELRVALEKHIEALGPAHPNIASARSNLSHFLTEQSKNEEAREEALQAVSILEAALRPGHPMLVKARMNYAVTLLDSARYEDAEEILRDILLSSASSDELRLAFVMTRQNLAISLRGQGQHEEALTEAREAATMMAKVLGPDAPRVARARNTVALSLMDLGRYDEAESEFRWILADAQERLGPDHFTTVLQRINLAEVLCRKGQPDQALPVAEQAWSEAQGEGIPADTSLYATFVLARALWDADGDARDRARARELGETARDGYRSLGEPYVDEVEKVRDWLDEHPAVRH